MSGLALHTIVVATDLSGNSAVALAWAEQLAQQHAATLVLVHAASGDPSLHRTSCHCCGSTATRYAPVSQHSLTVRRKGPERTASTVLSSTVRRDPGE
jgi:universal stress protein family protein